MEDAWLAVYEEFQEWRAGLEELPVGPHEPLSPNWWNAMIAHRMRSYDLATSRHISVADTSPNLDLLPMVVDPTPVAETQAADENDGCPPASDTDSQVDDHDGDGNMDQALKGNPVSTNREVTPLSRLCGTMPLGLEVDSVHEPLPKTH